MDNIPVCCSGGADGADMAWGDAASAAGHDVMHFIFKGHRSTAPKKQLYTLTKDQLDEANPYLEIANKTLKRNWPVSSYFVASLLRRNYFQIRYSDSLYAISGLDRKGLVKGGTAWAVQMMIDQKPNSKIYLFDQAKNSWFIWKGAWMPSMVPSCPTGVYAAIGSRELAENGRTAIQQVFNGRL